jgi:class 3 adenylate cyclase
MDRIADAVERFVTGSVAAREEQRVLATVLFTDIVDSTQHSAAVGDAEWRHVADAHDRTFRDLLVEHRGREIKTMGDGFLATFDRPAQAVRCALGFAGAVRDLGVSIRAGIHSGEVEVVGDDIAGLAVTIASRVVALASPDQVLVTSTVRDLTAGCDLAYQPRGVHDLKGVPGAWTILEAVKGRDHVGGLLSTTEPARNLTGRLLEQVAHRSPRLARVGARATRRLPRR